MIIRMRGLLFDFQQLSNSCIESPGCRLGIGEKLRNFKMYFDKINKTLKLD